MPARSRANRSLGPVTTACGAYISGGGFRMADSALSDHSPAARLDRLPWSRWHLGLTVVLGVAWLFDAFEVNVVGSVVAIVERLWHLSTVQSAAVVSLWLIGIMVGAIGFGYLADRFGRKRLFQLTLGMYALFTILTAFSWNYPSLLVWRFLTALGVGAEYSCINAAIGEFVPRRQRGTAMAAVANFWSIGALLAAGVSAVFIATLPPALGWRVGFAVGAVVALVFAWARRFVPESPRWLWVKGRRAEARLIVGVIEEASGVRTQGPMASDWDPPAADEEQPKTTFWRDVRILFQRYPGRVALGSLLDISEAFGYYGLFAFAPLVIFPAVHVAATHIPVYFVYGDIGALCGGVAMLAVFDRWGRKRTVPLAYGLTALSIGLLAWATATGLASAVLWSFIVVNFFGTAAWMSAYPTFAEIFPTELRSTGIGVSVGFGRLAAAVAPVLLTSVAARDGVSVAYWVLAGFWCIGVVAMLPWCVFGPEGAGASLEDLVRSRAPMGLPVARSRS